MRRDLAKQRTPRHRVFISYHDEDRDWKAKFSRQMGEHIIDRSVKIGNIDDTNIKTETIRQRIRDNFLRDSSVTVVLIGPCTWRRMHVDWEIGSSLRDTKRNPRSGLLGILLPNHPDYNKNGYNSRLMAPRLADNLEGEDPYAVIYRWPTNWAPVRIKRWIHRAFTRTKGTPPNNGRPQFVRNRRRKCSEGWKS